MTCEIDQAIVKPEKMEVVLLPEGVPPLTSLYLYIAGSCNLACKHCWITPSYQPGGDDGKFVKLEHVQKAIREAKPLGLHSIKLTGGEPTLHPKFRDIITLLANNNLDISIETNGILIDDGLATFLRESQRVCFISVSLDGLKPETHDALRSVPGSHAKAIAGIQSLVRAGFRPQLICTLHKGNISEMMDVIPLAKNLGCGSVKFNHVQSMGRGERFFEQNGLTVPDVIQLYNQVETEFSSDSQLPIHFDIPFAFFTIRKLLNNSLGRCTVQNILGMLSGGELSLCGIGVNTTELIYGNIETDDLKVIWCEAPGLAELRQLIPSQLEGICGDCLHRDLCQGECVANNYQRCGKLNSAYFFCEQAEMAGLFPFSRKRRIV